jgi:putative PIN family toxin of toxin-antitoxin system
VLTRFQSKPYLTPDEVATLITAYTEMVEWIPIIKRVQAGRDPKDAKFLELAINGHADSIITGDQDLLVLHPFCGINILTAKDFIATVLMA